ncbi:MAG: InlB B-repeat-containing protein [Acutalibacteraceae bacterium]|nr:InlB B-repeat-containing protein [Acutalibacteraceae bacterium]
MLLAVAMVLSIVPVSAMAAPVINDPTVAGVTYSKPDIQTVSFTVDTTATTEVIRVAAGTGTFSLADGTDAAQYTIVKATPSGVPESGGTYKHIAYAGETPVQATVRFSITGKKPVETPTVVPSVTGISFGTVRETTSGNTTTYEFPINGSGAALTPHTDVVFTINFKVGTVSYKAYAYSHIENIIVMNGVINYHHVEKSGSDTARYSAIQQYQSANMYTRMNGATYYVNQLVNGKYVETATADSGAKQVSNRTLGYINYATTTAHTSGDSLLGCGSEKDVDGSINAYASAVPNSAIAGVEQAALIKGSTLKDGDYSNKCTDDDTNRGEPIIYMDATDTLQSLNFRFTLQNGEKKDFGKLTLDGFTFWAPGSGYSIGSDSSSITATNVSTNVIAVQGLTYGSTGSSSISSADFNQYVLAKFSGNGPRTDTDINNTYVIFSDVSSVKGDRNLNGYCGINVIFRNYDTRDLRAMYNGMLAGTGSYTLITPTLTATYGALNLSFNKGVFPRRDMYNLNTAVVNPYTGANFTGNEWNTFEAALQTAGSVLAQPDTSQAEIDAAALNLYNAYYALPTPHATVRYTINHYIEGTTTPVVVNGVSVPAQTGSADMGSIMNSKAATIEGYNAVGTTNYTTDMNGSVEEVVVNYYYSPKNYNVRYFYNNPEFVDASGNIIAEEMVGYKYNTALDLDAIDRGTRNHYTFLGWYDNEYDPYDASFNVNSKLNNGTSAADITIVNDRNFHAIWKIAPLNVNVTPVTNQGEVLTAHKGTVGTAQLTSETDTKTVANPGDYNIDGYFFGGYYYDYDAATMTFSNPVSWPISFSFGDSDKEIYARMIDVNGRVSFNSNGGTDVPDITFEPGVPFAPSATPTKEGYTFLGWFNEDGSKQYFVNGTETLTNKTGFLAYAKWEANFYNITFDMGSATTDFDTTTAQMPVLRGQADSAIDPGDIPPEPTKFGKSFAQWVIKGTSTVFDFTTYPTKDIVLEPVWNNTKYSAFVSIGAYEKLAGEYEEVVNPTAASREGAAQAGDVITFRMTSQTNFFTGSSVFVFMYDKNFFELVESGTDAFNLNEENEYIKGIDATAIGVTNDALMNRVWPTTANMDRSTYNAMMVTIDPTVTTTNFNCEPMADGTWLVEFQLKVKDNATGSGTVYMHNDWTRTADNIMGTMFYGWAETKDASVAETFNSVVEPNLAKATATITIDETPQVQTTITADPNGGTWADGSTDAITYTGNAGTEIRDFANPVREGYVLTGWVKSDDASVTWNEGYHATEAQNGATFVAQWEPLKFTVNYYLDEGGELWDSEELAYGTPVDGPFYEIEKDGFDFAGWFDAATGDPVVIGETLVPLGGIDVYATWTAAPVDYKIVINYFNNNTQQSAVQTRTKQALAGSNVYIVETAGTEEGATYVLWSEFTAIQNGYIFDTENAENLALATNPTVIASDGSTVINVYYKAKTIYFTLDANGGAWTTGETSKVISGDFQTVATDEAAAAGEPVREGYNFKGWNNAKANADAGRAGNLNKFNSDATYYASWEAKKVPVTFDTNGGAFSNGTTTSSSELSYGSAITAPAAPTRYGYNFLGWSKDGSTVITDLGVADSFDGITFLAVWAKAEYDVTYFVDGIQHSTAKAEFESTVTFADYPADITGYSFDGWYYNGSKYAPGQTITMPASAIIIEGEFAPDTFKATFNANGGYFDGDEAKTVVENDVVFDSPITVPSAPARNGYEFLGWAESADSNATVVPGTMNTEGKTYYAVWKATIWDYKVEFYYMDTNGNYGAAAEGETITAQGNVASEVSYNPAAKTGFTVDTAASTLSGTVTVDPVLTLKVYYSRNQYSVYTTVDGTRTEAGKFYYGADVSVADAPAKEGYTFTGWTPAVETPMPAQDQELTAVYAVIAYPVTFYKDATKAETVYSGNVNYGTALGGLAFDPAMDGYTFMGWAYEGTDTILNLANEKVPVGGVSLVGIWEIESYTVNFRANNGKYADGTDLKSTTVTFGEAVVAPEEPTRTGYTFNGWNPALPSAIADGSAVRNHTAQWTPESYIVKFVIDGNVIEQPYTFGDDIYAPDETETVKEGYTFKYWMDADGNQVEIPAVMEDIGENGAEVVYTAYFEINSYGATWKNEDGSVYEGPVSYNYGADVNKPAVDPSKTGWTFKGWKAADGTLYDAATAVPAMGTADVAYTAYFEINEYTITFDTDGGSAVAPITQNYATAVTAPAAPSKTGYTFAGWDNLPATMPAENVTVKALWTINQYTITFDVDGGTEVAPITQDYNTAVTAPADPTKTGYTFTGWAPSVPATMPAENVTVKAQWTINSYTATFVSDGETIESKSYEYGAAVTRPSNPTKTGHTFAGWLSDAGILYGVGMDVPAMGTANVTYTAQWDINSYVVTWLNEDGSTFDSASYEYNAPVSKPAVNPVKEGWTFQGWKAADGTLYDAETAVPNMGTANVSYTAYFVINQYVIVFDAADGAFADGKSTYTITENYNTLVSKPGDPSLEGYTFKGWTTVENGTEADVVAVPSTWYVAAEDVNYYAVWVVNVYTVTFVNAEGEEYFTVDLDYGTVIQSPEAYEGYTADPALEHYTFEGWSLTEVALEQSKEDVAANVIDFATANITVPENGITIYPVFARVVVTLDTQDGSTAIVTIDENVDDAIVGYITGLETRLTKAKLLSTYLTVEGDGRLEVTLTKYKLCGTGARVDVIDNVTNEIVETYYIIIYGDVNGDSDIDATDASMIGTEAAGLTSWSNTIWLETENPENYDHCKVLAADVDGDGYITATDSTAIDDVSLWVATVDQQTGKVVYSA